MTGEKNARRIGETLLYFDELPTTMDYLKENAGELPDGTVVYAGRQTLGRGRQGRAWKDAAKGEGLAMSLLLRPQLPPEQFPLLPLVIGMAVRQALLELAPGDYAIKWPNDVVLSGKKVVGILCETQWGRDVFTVAGIGVNLLQDAARLESCGLPHATSVLAATGKTVTERETCLAICRALGPMLHRLEREGFAALKAQYEENCISVGREVQVLFQGETRRGFAGGVDEEGCLLVQFEDSAQRVRSGEASVRGLYGYV